MAEGRLKTRKFFVSYFLLFSKEGAGRNSRPPNLSDSPDVIEFKKWWKMKKNCNTS